MQDFLLEAETGDLTDMPTTKERFEGIDAQISEINNRLGITVADKESSWPKSWAGRIGMLAGILGIVASIVGAFWYLGGLIVDRHIQSALTPVQTDIHRIDGDVQFIKGKLSLLSVQISMQKYLTVPVKELKAHRNELAELKQALATSPRNTPGFWPTSTQIIQLLSESISGLEPANRPQITFGDASNVVAGVSSHDVYYPAGTRILLAGKITKSHFSDAIVTFGPNVKLENVTFTNCVLILPVQSNPPQNLQNLGAALLASDLSNVTIQSS